MGSWFQRDASSIIIEWPFAIRLHVATTEGDATYLMTGRTLSIRNCWNFSGCSH